MDSAVSIGATAARAKYHAGAILSSLALALALAGSANAYVNDTYIHEYCWPSEGATRTTYYGGSSGSWASVRGIMYNYYNQQWYYVKEDTDFSGYGPGRTARVALHDYQDVPLYQWGKHRASFFGVDAYYTEDYAWSICA